LPVYPDAPNIDLHHLIERDPVLAPIVELGRAGRCMRRHLARLLERAAVFKVGGDVGAAAIDLTPHQRLDLAPIPALPDVETANRFARDLIVQETGHRMLKERGIEIIAADSPSAYVDDTPTTTFVRQVLGAVAQLDKAMTVAKLRGARERKRRQAGWCKGGSPLHIRFPEAVRQTAAQSQSRNRSAPFAAEDLS